MEQPYSAPMPRLMVPDPALQLTRLNARMRLATCEEVGCAWFLEGKTGMDEGMPFTHPQGVACGDFTRCQPCRHKSQCGTCEPCKAGTANCPCPSRLRFEVVGGRHTGRRGLVAHDIDCRQPVQFVHATGAGPREVIEDEWVTRLHVGVESFNHITRRGL
jgi:hypothetical protein